MELLERVCRGIDATSRFTGRHIGNLYLVCVAATTYEVAMRYIFHAPTQWAFETTLMLCAITWLLSGGYVTLEHRHIRITAIYVLVPERAKWLLDLFSHLMGIVFVSGLAWAAWNPAYRALIHWETTGTAWDPPLPAIVKPMIVVGAALYVLQLLAVLIRHLRRQESETSDHGR
jgi:TRAP-type mannitol/chloroaromatic compound transport system permease small subunit